MTGATARGSGRRKPRYRIRAERAGFRSLWFPGHVRMVLASTSGHVVNESRMRAYETSHEMLDPGGWSWARWRRS